MDYEIIIKSSARKRLGRIPSGDRERLLKKIISLSAEPRPVGSVKLTATEAYRIRQGDYRIIYTIQDSILVVEVIRIGHRRDVYKD
ncbi:MAG: type II toxin-antitoxin system RelE/ParE family toxin [Verrucomicrobiota bacterium]